MKRLALVAVTAFLAGCSNAPLAGLLDACVKSKPHGTLPPDRLPDRNTVGPGDRIPPPDLGPPVGPAPTGN